MLWTDALLIGMGDIQALRLYRLEKVVEMAIMVHVQPILERGRLDQFHPARETSSTTGLSCPLLSCQSRICRTRRSVLAALYAADLRGCLARFFILLADIPGREIF